MLRTSGAPTFPLTATGSAATACPPGPPSTSGATMNIDSCLVSLFEEALACTRKLKLPLFVGVPAMTPFEARLNPSGRAPAASDRELTFPPEADSCAEYG